MLHLEKNSLYIFSLFLLCHSMNSQSAPNVVRVAISLVFLNKQLTARIDQDNVDSKTSLRQLLKIKTSKPIPLKPNEKIQEYLFEGKRYAGENIADRTLGEIMDSKDITSHEIVLQLYIGGNYATKRKRF